MEREEFLKFAKKHRRITFGPKAYFGLTWAEYAKFTKLVGTLNFGCDIKYGVCASEKKHDGNSKKCCCYGCQTDVGYMRRLPKHNAAISSVAKAFDKENGFWREDGGCVLPRKYRSKICVLHRCEAAKENFVNDHLKHGVYDRDNARQALIIYSVDYARLFGDLHSSETTKKRIADLIRVLIRS